TTPPIAKASHIALPAACATTPRIEKIPAPTMPPMPIDTAAIMPIAEPALTGGTFIAELMARLADRSRRAAASPVSPLAMRARCRTSSWPNCRLGRRPRSGTDVAKRSESETALRRLAPRMPRHEFAAVVDHAVDSPGLTVATPETAAWLSLVAYV